MEKLGLSLYDAEVLTADEVVAGYYDKVLAADIPAKIAANWVSSELMGALKARELELAQSPIDPVRLSGLIKLVTSGKITGKIGKDVFAKMFEDAESAEKIVADMGVTQISDTSAIEQIVDEIIAANPKQAEQYRGGKESVLGYFVGQVMKKSRGQANPQITQELLKKKLMGG
jgi:aspartyl-tRNA(Asn)/glutamyl-tRNA(Gln) amidotransferase subunit B